MPGDLDQGRWGNRAALAAAFGLALFASGCSGSGMFGGPSTASVASSAPATAPPPAAPATTSSTSGVSWLRSDFSDFFSSSTDKGPEPVAGASSPNLECPYIQIREGASTLIVSTGGDNQAMSLKYEGTFVRAARQCALVNGQMVMKVGVEGRIILGPQGGPGEITVPLRIAIVDQTPAETKSIVTKLIPIPVAVTSIDNNPTFTYVANDLSFPMPSAAKLENYIVYIGFDPLAAEAQKRHERPRRRIERRMRHKPVFPPAPTG